jgi:hypothetical protein
VLIKLILFLFFYNSNFCGRRRLIVFLVDFSQGFLRLRYILIIIIIIIISLTPIELLSS